MVFSYSATCPGYGCTIYEPYYHVDRKLIDRCDLEGTANGFSFRIDNFSTQPYTQCYSIPYRTSKQWNTVKESYYMTPEYTSCRNVLESRNTRWGESVTYFSDREMTEKQSMIFLLEGYRRLYSTGWTGPAYVNRSEIQMDPDQYIAYLENCDPLKDPQCPGWIVNGIPLKQDTKNRPFMNNATHLKDHPCDTFLVREDPALFVPDNEMPDIQCLYSGACNVPNTGFLIGSSDIHRTCSNTSCMMAQDFCEARFTIPDNRTPAIVSSGEPDEAPAQRSPVESLYCGIIEFLGGRCE
jgi:hypothetical protein